MTILVLRRNYLLSKRIIIRSLKILKKFYHREKEYFFLTHIIVSIH